MRSTMPHHTLFISDLHLEPGRPDSAEWFLHFLKNQAPQADALYILGDFFEVWIGDDHDSPFNKSIEAGLKTLTDTGFPIYFMRGNRDFLIGEAFAKATGCRLLPDPCKIDLYGKPILITHGDILCTQDVKHLKFRKFAQNPANNRYFLLLPLFLRKFIARQLRKASKNHTRQTAYHIMDVTPEAVDELMQAQGVNLLIHGHTHRPNMHFFRLKDQSASRIVLGSWHEQGNALIYYADGKCEFFSFPS